MGVLVRACVCMWVGGCRSVWTCVLIGLRVKQKEIFQREGGEREERGSER